MDFTRRFMKQAQAFLKDMHLYLSRFVSLSNIKITAAWRSL
jgi:hypothetical protein